MSDDDKGCCGGCLLLIVVILSVAIWNKCTHLPGEMTLEEARKRGVVTLEVRAKSGRAVMVKVTLHSGQQTTVIVPAGTLYQTGAQGVQSVVGASSVRLYFEGGLVRQVVAEEQQVYCVDRFLNPPDDSTEYVVDDEQSEAKNEIRKLAACLERSGAERKTRNIAVWLVKEGLLQKNQSEAVTVFRERAQAERQQRLKAAMDYAAATLARRKAPPDLIERVKERYRDQEIEKAADSTVAAELQGEWTAARPLLEACGYDVKESPFFRSAP